MLEGFRDCHCHLLPGVDDGVQEMGESMEILKAWESLGVKEVWFTPHIMEDIPNTPEDLHTKFVDFKAKYPGSIQLHLAAEHMMDGLFLKRLNSQLSTLNFQLSTGDKAPAAGSHLLVETSYYTPPMNMGDIIEKVQNKGFEPILAHPERYQYMDQRDYRRWKELGVLFQMNLPSLVGAYGPEVFRKAEWLLKENMYDYCGSDTHSIDQMDRFLNSVISKKKVKKVKQIIDKQVL